MAWGNFYLVRFDYGGRRGWRAVPWSPMGCTHDELPGELCRKLRIDVATVVSLTCEPNGEVARSKGREWELTGTCVAGTMA
jgi:hypothetical protein